MLSALRRAAADEEGNSLILFPFAVLVLFALGGIALDAAVAFQADRRAVDEASALANDIAGVVDAGSFFGAPGSGVAIDPAFASAATSAANARLGPDLSCASVVAGDQVTVTCAGTAQPIIMPALGGLTQFQVNGTAVASAVEGG